MEHNCYEIQIGENSAKLYTYILSSSPEIGIYKRPLVLICPGGGYELTSDREAEPVAMQLLAAGIHACILRYSVAPARFPTALAQAAKSIALIRENVEKWHIDEDKIGVMGFSAGGHLAASIGVFWNNEFLRETTKLPSSQIKPNAILLCYPVITSGEFCHSSSFEKLLGDDAYDEAKREFVSLEKQVTTDTPPTFIWHTLEDVGVPVENSLLMMNALRKSAVPFEAHLYPKGRHGLSLGNFLTDKADAPGSMTENPEVCGWIEMAIRWIQDL